MLRPSRRLALLRRLAIVATLFAAAFGASESIRAQSFRFDTAEPLTSARVPEHR